MFIDLNHLETNILTSCICKTFLHFRCQILEALHERINALAALLTGCNSAAQGADEGLWATWDRVKKMFWCFDVWND